MSGQIPAREPESPWIHRAQLGLLFGFSMFAGMIILWVARLMYISWVLEDVFSASIGIALVAVPVFLFLLGIFNYVFWGLLNGREEAMGLPEDRAKGPAGKDAS